MIAVIVMQDLSLSSVKILRRSAEEIEKEEREFQEARQEFINQAVDKTMEKITVLMRENGVIFTQSAGTTNNKGREDRDTRKKGKTTSDKSNRDQGNDKPKEKSSNKQANNRLSNSETTIYDNAIQPASISNVQPNDVAKRISTSSEELADTSDELIDNFNNLNTIESFADKSRRSDHGRECDRFYDRQLQPGTSGNSNQHQGRNRSPDRDQG